MNNRSTQTGGRLHVIATPIGNIEDLSPRAADTLGRVALIAAEDTRRTGRLLMHIGAKTRLLACHEHNEEKVLEVLIAALHDGADVALVSDAGTPLISDPGWRLVRSAAARGYEIVTVPGPSAVTAALSVSGLPTDRFVFEGFLPRRAAQRRDRLDALAAEARTMVFFESVHRIAAAVDALVAAFGADRPAALARELTKIHESVSRGTLGDLAAGLGSSIPLLGEFVLVVGGAEVVDSTDAEIIRTYALLADELPPAKARSLCVSLTGASRNRVYALTQT